MLFLIGVVFISFKISPYPSIWIIRYAFNKDALQTNEALKIFVSKKIESKLNIQYDTLDKDAYFDLYFHKDSVKENKELPVIVWTHGGGLVSGNKEQLSNYCKILASEGYAVVSIDYSIAPERKFPTPLLQLNKALEFITANEKKLNIDSSFIVLGGDSGGSMITAQVANIITNKNYSKLTKIKSNIRPNQLKGLLLYCGIYDLTNLNTKGDFNSFMKTVSWAYFGEKDIHNNSDAKTASVTNYLSSKFPTSFISAGNADPLLPQSKLLASKLTKLNVKIDTLFYSKERKPPLKHEYQFTFDEAGKSALKNSLNFLKKLK